MSANGNDLPRRLGRVETRLGRLERAVTATNRRIDETNRRLDETNRRLDETNRNLAGVVAELHALNAKVDAMPRAFAEAMAEVLEPRFRRLESDSAETKRDIASMKKQISAIFIAVHRGGGNSKPH